MSKKTREEVFPIGYEAKDRFFKKVYESEERLKNLAAFLSKKDFTQIEVSNVKPVLFGNKENDLAFLCNRIIYYMLEEQSTYSPNIPYRMLEYITIGLRSMIDTEKSLYGKTQITFPIPKLYVIFVGLEETKGRLKESVQYDMHLSDAYKREENIKLLPLPDLELVVHAYDFRMTYEEAFEYIEENSTPNRFTGYHTDLIYYALTANSLTYAQQAERYKKYKMPSNIRRAKDIFELLESRGIFVDLFSNKEVCDMTLAQFSREDIIRYQGIEEGIEKGMEKTKIELIQKKLDKGKSSIVIADELEESVETIERMIKENGLK